MLGGTFFSAISQILLKQSANKKYDNPLREYLNWRVILAYVMFFGILLLNTWCYTKVDMRYGPVIDTAEDAVTTEETVEEAAEAEEAAQTDAEEQTEAEGEKEE